MHNWASLTSWCREITKYQLPRIQEKLAWCFWKRRQAYYYSTFSWLVIARPVKVTNSSNFDQRSNVCHIAEEFSPWFFASAIVENQKYRKLPTRKIKLILTFHWHPDPIGSMGQRYLYLLMYPKKIHHWWIRIPESSHISVLRISTTYRNTLLVTNLSCWWKKSKQPSTVWGYPPGN